MHARQLAQLAALVAHHMPTLLHGTRPIPQTRLEQYWAVSKTRLDHWLRALKAHQVELGRSLPRERPALWQTARPLLEEILLSEMLTRVWAGVGCAVDHRLGTGDLEPITRSVLVGHLEARNRALQVIVFGHGLSAEEAVELNRLRRRVERWTDLLIGYVLLEHPAVDLAFDRSRARDFAEDLRYERQAGTQVRAWELVVSALQVAFRQEGQNPAASAALNQQIAAAVIGCYGADLFDSLGLLKSLWQIRLAQATNDAQGLLEQVLSFEATDKEPCLNPSRPQPRWHGRSTQF